MIKDDKGLYFIWFVWFVYLVNIIQEKSNDVGFFLIWSIMLLFMMLFVVKPMKEYQIRYQKYGRIPPFEHREKMKYITNFSRDKVIETLCQYQEAHGIFEYTFEMETDGVFIFTINSIRQEYGYCGGKIKVSFDNVHSLTVFDHRKYVHAGSGGGTGTKGKHWGRRDPVQCRYAV